MPQSKFIATALIHHLTLNSLRGDQETLEQLREQLCILWGNLEENKLAGLKHSARGVSKPASKPEPSQHIESSDPQPWKKAGEQPNVDSDEENDAPQPKSSARVSGGDNGRQDSLTNTKVNTDMQIPVPVVSNKAFTCCIKQYGAKVKEDDPSKANAGSGKKWKRIFALFGTQIV